MTGIHRSYPAPLPQKLKFFPQSFNDSAPTTRYIASARKQAAMSAALPIMYNVRILNPHLLSLLARVRHTNSLVIADRGFPAWPQIETIDLSLVDDVPTVLQVLAAIRPDFRIQDAYMAREFVEYNSLATQERFTQALVGIAFSYEPHEELKRRVPSAVGLIRTGDTTQYANVILVSGPGPLKRVTLDSASTFDNAELAGFSQNIRSY